MRPLGIAWRPALLVRGGSHAHYVPTGHLVYGAGGTRTVAQPLAVAGLLVLLCTPCVEAQHAPVSPTPRPPADLSPAFRRAVLGNLAIHGMDLGVTLYGLETRPGSREGNPVLGWAGRHPASISAVWAGSAAAATWARTSLYRRHHQKLAWTLVIVDSLVNAYIVVHNFRQL